MTAPIQRRTEEVPIFEGEDDARIEELRQALTRAEQRDRMPSSARRLGDESQPREANEAKKALDAAVQEALPRAVVVKVQALGRKRYRSLIVACPPREGNEVDMYQGYDTDAMSEALLEFFDAETGEKSIIAPQFDSRSALVEWLDNLNDGTFSAIFSAAVRVNEGGPVDPKAVSELARPSSAT